jgi:hypothetical protein
MNSTIRLLCVAVMCLGVITVAQAAPPGDVAHELLQATAHAPMKGALRGALLKIVNAARQELKADDSEGAGEQLEAYVALLEAQTGTGIGAADAAPLIALAEAIRQALAGYPFAADYERVPVFGGSSSGGGTVDWRTKGVVSGVGTEGSCTSDHAFSATGAVEGAWGIAKGQLIDLSEQQLIDCDGASFGCDGGSPVRALEFGLANGGFASESAYPYTALEGTCKSATPVVTISGLGRPVPGDEDALEFAVRNVGPVSAVRRVRGSAWDTYAGGLFDPATAATGATRWIAVLIVGFSVDSGSGTPYWIVKTSNGSSWGEGGYVRIPRGQNALGIADYLVVPII